MAEKKKRLSSFYVKKSVLERRISRGEADPIGDEERQIAADLRSFYVNKYGDVGLPGRPEVTSAAKTA